MKYLTGLVATIILVVLQSCNSGTDTSKSETNTRDSVVGITLPEGFSATVFVDSVGQARHLAVNGNGDVYVKLDKLYNAWGILRLRDSDNDGKAEDISGFGNYTGTGIFLRNGYLYATSDTQVFRYPINNNGVENQDKPELLVTGLIDRRQHASKSIALDDAGNIYVNIGAPSNSCQEQDRSTGSMGRNPCPILDSAGGIWQFRIDKQNQTYGDGVRFATGLRNIVGLDWNAQQNQLYAMQHGRDDLNRLFPNMYTVDESVNLPAEELFLIKKNGDYGWPYCYYDQVQKKKLTAPEYGGDKIKTTGCDGKEQPLYAFPGHWAPNGLLFYTGKQFPEKYQNGAFIAFHGSWNRAPRDQEGYNVVFLPFKDGKPSGDYEIFADGFAGAKKTPTDATFRPCGLAQGPDGSLYISDDKKGRIWKVSYKGK